MEYRRLGRSGLQVSALSFGSWLTFGNQVDDSVARQMMHTAYDLGINFFDNAEQYAAGESERVMGRIIKDTNWDRTTYLVSSKVYWGGEKPNQYGLSRKHVIEACHAALKRLHVEYLDLYFCHRPDLNVPIEETVRAMTELIWQGKVLYWGTSEWSAQEIQEAYAVARQYDLIPPTMEQPQYNMFHRERFEKEYHRLYRNEVGLGTTIWSPLASGLLTGKYLGGNLPAESRATSHPELGWLTQRLTGETAQKREPQVAALKALADELDTTLPRLALAWCLKNPNVSTVITGSSKVEQIHDNIHAIDLQKHLTHEVMERIEGILANKPHIPSYY